MYTAQDYKFSQETWMEELYFGSVYENIILKWL